MNDKTTAGVFEAPEMMRVRDEIVQLIHPQAIYLFSCKFSVSGDTTSFKLCIIADVSDKAAAEHGVYLGVDSEVPFDIVLYTPDEWQRHKANAESFACRVCESGRLIYGEA